ncbi:MAG: SMP-30/gluconolactonase/LRE family protein [Paenibacillaceae bacterium]
MNECKPVLDAKAGLGEGAIWDAEKQVLYWVDITGEALHIFDPEQNHRPFDRDWPISRDCRTQKSGRGYAHAAEWVLFA